MARQRTQAVVVPALDMNKEHEIPVSMWLLRRTRVASKYSDHGTAMNSCAGVGCSSRIVMCSDGSGRLTMSASIATELKAGTTRWRLDAISVFAFIKGVSLASSQRNEEYGRFAASPARSRHLAADTIPMRQAWRPCVRAPGVPAP